MTSFLRPTVVKKSFGALLAACLVSAGLAACSPQVPTPPQTQPEVQPEPTEPQPVPAQTVAYSTDLEASSSLFAESPVAIVAAGDELAQARAAATALALRAPMLTVQDNADAIAAELQRLGVQTVLAVGDVTVPAAVDVMVDPGSSAALTEVVGSEVQTVETVGVGDLVAMDPAAPSAPEIPTLEPGTSETFAESSPESAGSNESEDAADSPAGDPAEDTQEAAGRPRMVEVGPLEKGEVGIGNEGAAVFATGNSPLGVVANARTAGLDPVVLPQADPRATSESMTLMRESEIAVGLGPDFGGTDRLQVTAELAANTEELPGGGGLVFPGRRMTALYGHPWGGALGVLGEQGAQEAAALAKQYAEQYQPFSSQQVIPAFEIIATVAAGGPGDDGNYSNVTPAQDLVPYIDAITEVGGYAILDLQPGRASLLDQAKIYEDLLKRPNVGLALDPEWKLYGDEVPLQQIGHIDVSEANEVSEWLATLTRQNNLPQKVFMLHQFQLQMIRNRDQLNTGHPELAIVLHADGHGTPGMKMDTWNAMREGLPGGVWMAWKNFIDEDQPMLNPEQTMGVEPSPWIVSFQ
ncbi:MAG: hypothetical protein Q4D87_04170 [Actinomycetaceae bacterium]|nr:hypothetical protein [Actinomycetaceae bacterium]